MTLSNRSDEFMNILARDWSEYVSTDREVVPLESAAQECVPPLPEAGQSVLFGLVQTHEQSAVIRMTIPQAS